MGKFYRFANRDFFIECAYSYFYNLAKDYEIKESKNFIEINNTKQEIEKWRTDHNENNFPLFYIESLLIHAKIASFFANDDIFIFHGSTIYVDNLKNSYIFTAPSGTGKSTHISILKKLYGDRIGIINDDKPFISKEEESYYVYGSPWDGKERRSLNTKGKLKGIFIVTRSLTNSVKEITPNEAIMKLIGQIHLPTGEKATKKGTDFLFKLISDLPIYLLEVNMDDEAGKTSMQVMEKSEVEL